MSVQDVRDRPNSSVGRSCGRSEAPSKAYRPPRRFAANDNGGPLGSPYVRLGGKRLVDIAVSLAAILLLLPVLPVIVLALVVQDGLPILFRQERVGRGGGFFQCLKFRSMMRDSDRRLNDLLATCPHSREEWTAVQKLRRDPRVHAVGSILRRSSLDELPQLWNVLRGDMSIVGPRPIMPDQVALYGGGFAGYTKVKPGITGPWQVGGRNELTFEQRIALDAGYAQSVSFVGDMRILARTVRVVVTGRGSF